MGRRGVGPVCLYAVEPRRAGCRFYLVANPTTDPIHMSDGNYQYDVALSFAGEDRDYVAQVAERVKAQGINVFYDEYEVVNLWGKDLYSHLRDIYGRRSRYTVIFISKHYANKVWTNHERESAQARALKENKEYILPARFDDTEVPGLLETVSYVDLRDLSPVQFADYLVMKISDENADGVFIKAKVTPEQRPGILISRRLGSRVIVVLVLVILLGLFVLIEILQSPEVTLLWPQNGATISQPYISDWTFRWAEPKNPNNIRRYHLVVSGGKAGRAEIDTTINETSYAQPPLPCSFIIDENLSPWRWKVRAQYHDGTWSAWSEERIFHVETMNRIVYCNQCPSASAC